LFILVFRLQYGIRNLIIFGIWNPHQTLSNEFSFHSYSINITSTIHKVEIKPYGKKAEMKQATQEDSQEGIKGSANEGTKLQCSHLGTPSTLI
jgi:hypothetical protein